MELLIEWVAFGLELWYNRRMNNNTITNDLILFSIHATMRTESPYAAIFVVAAKDADDSIECIREFLGDRFGIVDHFEPDPIGLAAGSGMRPDAIFRGVVVSSQI